MGRTKRRDVRTTGIQILLAGASVAVAYGGWRLAQKQILANQNRNLARGKRIVILGGGFAGAGAAEELARLLPNAEDAEIILVDKNDYLLFTPMLTEAAGGQIDTKHILRPLHTLSPRVTFAQAEVKTIDLTGRKVTVSVGAGSDDVPQTERDLPFDHLVIALGAVTNYRNIPGMAEHSLGMKSINEAREVLNRALALLVRANDETDADKRKALLTFIVGGGGYTGVETMAALNDLVRDEAKNYPKIHPSEIRTLLIEATERLLPELKADNLAAFAKQKLEARCVEVRLKTEIAEAGDDYIQIKDGERIPANLVVWAGGVEPNPAVKALNAKIGKHGGLLVDACCRVPDQKNIWALGDCAEIPEPNGKGAYAPTAQNATREGITCARNIVATLRGEEPEPFVYTPIGELALVGKNTGVAQVYGVNISGRLAWAMWRGVYLAKMPDWKQRTRILLDWLLDLTIGRAIVEQPVAPVQPNQ